MSDEKSVSRRRILALVGSLGSSSIAGCSQLTEPEAGLDTSTPTQHPTTAERTTTSSTSTPTQTPTETQTETSTETQTETSTETQTETPTRASEALVQYYTFDGSSFPVEDRAGSATATRVGDARLGVSGRVATALGARSGGVTWDRTRGPSLDRGEFTVSFWIRTDASTGLGYRPVYVSSRNKLFVNVSRGAAQFVFDDIEGNRHKLRVPERSYNDGSWHHFVQRWDGNTYDVWLDGEKVAESTVAASGVAEHTSERPGGIGVNPKRDTNYPCDVDDFRVYNYALTDDEIASVYDVDSDSTATPTRTPTDTRTVNRDGLVQYYTFDGSSFPVEDRSGSATAKRVNDAKLGISGKFGSGLDARAGGVAWSASQGPTLDGGSFTVSLWIRTVANTETEYRPIFISGRQQLFVNVHRGDAQFVFDDTDTDRHKLRVAENSYNDGSWHHLVQRWDGNTYDVWLDGSKVAESSVTADAVAAAEKSGGIGVNRNRNTNYPCDVDDFRVYNRALTNQEISRVYRGES